MSDPRTPPLATMEKCVEAAKEHLDYVYVGNASIPGGSDTTCPPECGELLIERPRFGRVVLRLEEDEALCPPECGHRIPVRFAREPAGRKLRLKAAKSLTQTHRVLRQAGLSLFGEGLLHAVPRQVALTPAEETLDSRERIH